MYVMIGSDNNMITDAFDISFIDFAVETFQVSRSRPVLLSAMQ